MRKLEGRVAVVTGAGSGIGRATSELLARRGCTLAAVDVNAEGLRETTERVRSVGTKVSTHVADVSDRERMRALPDEVIRQHGHVHILMNNAGVTVSRSFEDHTLEDLDWIVGANLWGVIYGCKFFLPYLEREEEAHVVNVSSMAGFIGLPAQSSYCATKSAVSGLTESLWAELASTRVGVTCVYPGVFRTKLLRTSRGAEADLTQRLSQGLERFGRSPDHAARKIVRAIERGKRRVIIGPEAHLTVWMKRLFPVLPHTVLAWGYRRAGNG
jgi:NAD(P)-dependent dehydrogenase (short-subunit alcohol dehydrogenase family)